MKSDLAGRIVRADVWAVNVPLLHEWIASEEMGGSHSHGHDRVILRLTDSDGRTGFGEGVNRGAIEGIESAARWCFREPLSEQRMSCLQLCDPGHDYWSQPTPPSPYAQPQHKHLFRVRHPFQTMFETAIYDLLGRRAGLPMSSFFGGRWRDRVLTDYWVGRATPELAARAVKRGLKLGFTRGIKVKTILEDPNVERLEAIRDAAGSTDYHVTVDPNGRFYNLDDALRVLLAMDRVGNMTILEDPFPRFYPEQLASLRPRISARLVWHIDPPESIWQVMAANVVGGLNIDSHTMGMFQWRLAAGAAYIANLPVWHGSGLDLGFCTAAQLQLASATPNCTLPGDQIGPWLREHTLVKVPFTVEDSHVTVPIGPGLGVDADMDAIDKYATRHVAWTA